MAADNTQHHPLVPLVRTVLTRLGLVALAWQPVDLTSDPDDAHYVGDPCELVGALEELLAAVERPAWHAQAACRGKGPDRWFPGQGGDYEAAQAVCADCPVRAACLAAADVHGIWGGLSAKARKEHRRHAA